MRLVLQVAVGIGLGLMILRFLPGGPLAAGARDQVVNVETGDTEMNAAMAEARDTLDEFLKVAEDSASGASNFAIKVAITDDNGVEHFWLTPFERNDDGFVGTINNEPAQVKSVSLGQRYQFQRADISDWMYMKDGRMHGNRTLRVLLPRMPEEQAAQYRAMLAE